jgi:hypothetical protein
MSSFITIDATRDVFELVLARPVVSAGAQHARLVHLWWRAPMQGDRLVQVYVNDGLYDVTLDPTVRETLLVLDRTRPNRIELLAVMADDPQAVWRPQPALLTSWKPHITSDARVSLVRDIDLPVATQLVVSVDGAITNHGPMWPATETRSTPGDDTMTGLGLGVGELGAGPLGYDGNAWRWKRDDLAQGSQTVRIDALDHTGQAVADPLEFAVTIEQLPLPVIDLAISPGFELSWNVT